MSCAMQAFIACYCAISLIKSVLERRNYFELETDGYYNRKAKVLQHYKNKSLYHFGKNRYCDGLAERADVIFTLMHQYPHFDETELYANFRDDVVRSLKERLKRGHILLNGTNATLFGNGTELLKYLASEDFTSELKPGQIRCERFGNGTKLLCARSPHITMGNLYCVENALSGGIWDYTI